MKLDFTVGKYTLESLTNGMYSSPLDLYREYIQNAVDSFDAAISSGIAKFEELHIDVEINTSENSIIIKDNGCGISKDSAEKTLLDIGNSQKNRSIYRGFRGIGRLAGLGYCDMLTFTTTAQGENLKTIISFNAKKLKELLMQSDEYNNSIHQVLEEIVSIKYAPEKSTEHYFEVALDNIEGASKLIDKEIVEDYLLQHSPLPFSMEFKWQQLILKKYQLLGGKIDSYKVFLNFDGSSKELFKPYKNSFVADRIKKLNDDIKDISVVPFYRKDRLCAILWYAQANYFGTILDNAIKGIRIRQGNILIGDKSTCNQFFKEERFNGWLLGELHVFDRELIINSRRDDFEKNEVYYEFVDSLSEWSLELSKEIRKKSYDRSLSNEKKTLIEVDDNTDINNLETEDMDFACDYDEASLLENGESQFLAENDFFDKLSMILNQKKGKTKYSALNINDRFTIDQKKVLERVFDVISQEFDKEDAEKFITIISKKY